MNPKQTRQKYTETLGIVWTPIIVARPNTWGNKKIAIAFTNINKKKGKYKRKKTTKESIQSPVRHSPSAAAAGPPLPAWWRVCVCSGDSVTYDLLVWPRYHLGVSVTGRAKVWMLYKSDESFSLSLRHPFIIKQVASQDLEDCLVLWLQYWKWITDCLPN